MLILFYGPHLYKAAAKFTHAVYQMVAGLAFFQAAGVSLVIGFPFRGQILNVLINGLEICSVQLPEQAAFADALCHPKVNSATEQAGRVNLASPFSTTMPSMGWMLTLLGASKSL